VLVLGALLWDLLVKKDRLLEKLGSSSRSTLRVQVSGPLFLALQGFSSFSSSVDYVKFAGFSSSVCWHASGASPRVSHSGFPSVRGCRRSVTSQLRVRVEFRHFQALSSSSLKLKHWPSHWDPAFLHGRAAYEFCNPPPSSQ
jgi:hypothetical protein